MVAVSSMKEWHNKICIIRYDKLIGNAYYYGNQDNDGHIMFAFYNIKDVDVEIKKGDAIGQGIFQKYFVVDNDNAEGERLGGFGSTNK